MSVPILLTLLITGVIVLAATAWAATRSAARAKRAESAAGERSMPPPLTTAPLLARASVPAAPPIFAPQNGEGGDVLTLLRRAHEQLNTRQQRIDSELARIEQLRGEREAVAVQAAALDQAMKAFALAQPVSYQMKPDLFDTNGNGSAAELTA